MILWLMHNDSFGYLVGIFQQYFLILFHGIERQMQTNHLHLKASSMNINAFLEKYH